MVPGRELVHYHYTTKQMSLLKKSKWWYIDVTFKVVKAWSVFQQNIRTNNDVKGWHHKLIKRAGRGQIQFYLLVDLLHEESKFVEAQARLIQEDKISRKQRRVQLTYKSTAFGTTSEMMFSVQCSYCKNVPRYMDPLRKVHQLLKVTLMRMSENDNFPFVLYCVKSFFFHFCYCIIVFCQ